MSLLLVLAGAVGTVVTGVITYYGARAVQRATAAKLTAEAGVAEATAEKSAVDGYDLLTGRLEARLTASEKREADLLARLAEAEHTIVELRAQLGTLTRRLSAYIDEDQGQEDSGS